MQRFKHFRGVVVCPQVPFGSGDDDMRLQNSCVNQSGERGGTHLLLGNFSAFVLLLLVQPSFGAVPRTCDPEPTNMLLTYGDTVTCSIEVVGDTDGFRFSGTAGEKVIILAGKRAGGFAPGVCVELFGSPAGGGAARGPCLRMGSRPH